MLVYRSSRIWCTEVDYKLRVTFGVEWQLRKILYIKYPKVLYLYGMNEESSSKDMDSFRYDTIFRSDLKYD